MQRDVEAVAFAGKVFAQLMFGFDQDRTVFIFHHLAQAHAQGVVVLPQDGRQVIPLATSLSKPAGRPSACTHIPLASLLLR
jgi:hypothetical protein